MIFWIVFLTIIFILGIIFIRKKIYLGSFFCFIASFIFGQFIPCSYLIMVDNKMISISINNLNLFIEVCKYFMIAGVIGLLLNVFIIFLTEVKENIQKDKKELIMILDEIKNEVNATQNYLNAVLKK